MEGKLTNFDVIQSITDIERYSELIFDLLKDKESPEEIQAFLKDGFPEDAIGSLSDMAGRGYPLSLERLQ